MSIGIGRAANVAIMGSGILYGAISGFVGGLLDGAMMRCLDALYGLPYLPFAIITLAIFGTVNFWTMVIALTVASWFTTARVMRGQIISLKENDYVQAARAIGARWHRILFRHLLPNTLGLVIVFVFLELPGVVLGEAFLSFLGLGINPPNASWGSLAQDGYTQYLSHPYLIVIPSVAIAWLILTAFFIADGPRHAPPPRTPGRAHVALRAVDRSPRPSPHPVTHAPPRAAAPGRSPPPPPYPPRLPRGVGLQAAPTPGLPRGRRPRRRGAAA